MNRKFTHISLDERLLDAKKLFSEQDHNYLLVIHKKRCAGVLNSADMSAALSPYLETEGVQQRDLLTLEKRVHQVMNKEFPKVNADSSVTCLESIFLRNPDALVVVNDEQSQLCVGVITVQDLLRYKIIENDEDLNGYADCC